MFVKVVFVVSVNRAFFESFVRVRETTESFETNSVEDAPITFDEARKHLIGFEKVGRLARVETVVVNERPKLVELDVFHLGFECGVNAEGFHRALNFASDFGAEEDEAWVAKKFA